MRASVKESNNSILQCTVGPIWQRSLTTLAPRMWLNDEVYASSI